MWADISKDIGSVIISEFCTIRSCQNVFVQRQSCSEKTVSIPRSLWQSDTYWSVCKICVGWRGYWSSQYFHWLSWSWMRGRMCSGLTVQWLIWHRSQATSTEQPNCLLIPSRSMGDQKMLSRKLLRTKDSEVCTKVAQSFWWVQFQCMLSDLVSLMLWRISFQIKGDIFQWLEGK